MSNPIAFDFTPFLMILGVLTSVVVGTYAAVWVVKRRKDAKWEAAANDAANGIAPGPMDYGFLSMVGKSPEDVLPSMAPGHDPSNGGSYMNREEKFYDSWSDDERNQLALEIFNEVNRMFSDLRDILLSKRPAKTFAVGPIAPGYKPLNQKEVSGQSFVQSVQTIEGTDQLSKELADHFINPPVEPVKAYEPDEEDEKFYEEVLKETFSPKQIEEAALELAKTENELMFGPSVETLRSEYDTLDEDTLIKHVTAALMSAGLEDLIIGKAPAKKKAKAKPTKKKTAKKRK